MRWDHYKPVRVELFLQKIAMSEDGRIQHGGRRWSEPTSLCSWVCTYLTVHPGPSTLMHKDILSTPLLPQKFEKIWLVTEYSIELL